MPPPASSTRRARRRARVTATTGGRSSWTHRTSRGGPRSSPWPAPSSDRCPGGPRCRRRSPPPSSPPSAVPARSSTTAPLPVPLRSATPGSVCSAVVTAACRRSGAVATAGPTASCRSPGTRTRTPWRSRSATVASRYSPTPAPTATTPSRSGGATSGPPSRTTRSSWDARTSPSPAGRSCGSATPARQSSQAMGRAGRQRTTDTAPSFPRQRTRERSPSTTRTAACGSSTRSMAQGRTRSGWRSTSAPPSEPNSTARERCLSWSGRGGPQRAELLLPPTLDWTADRGSSAPLLGWYSPRFGTLEPAWALVGSGRCTPGRTELVTTLRFGDGLGGRPVDVLQGVLPASCE